MRPKIDIQLPVDLGKVDGVNLTVVVEGIFTLAGFGLDAETLSASASVVSPTSRTQTHFRHFSTLKRAGILDFLRGSASETACGAYLLTVMSQKQGFQPHDLLQSAKSG